MIRRLMCDQRMTLFFLQFICMIGRAEPLLATIIVWGCVPILVWKPAEVQIKYCKLHTVTAIKVRTDKILQTTYSHTKQVNRLSSLVVFRVRHMAWTRICFFPP